MDTFVTKRKRRAEDELAAEAEDEDTPTEVKLALLASLLDDDDGDETIGPEALLDVLLAHEGSVVAAAEALKNTQAAQKRFKIQKIQKSQKSQKTEKTEKTLETQESQRQKSLKTLGSPPKRLVIGQQTSLRRFASPEKRTRDGELSAASAASTASAVPPLLWPAPSLARRGRTLFLYDPIDVARHTPCTLVHNFLPAETATALLREMLTEAQTFAMPRFQLFERPVSSPRTVGFYADHDDVHYAYNGARMTDVRQSTPHMLAVRTSVQTAVNAAVDQRIAACYPGGRKLRFQHPGPWRPNAAVVNCYSGGQQTVGWHSDQLTYVGPHPVIGSLSLGVAREFRVRRVVPRHDEQSDSAASAASAADIVNDAVDADASDADAAGQISIHLPHNSLLVMHADMQEQWKHCVAPAMSIDPHPMAGNKRINITYRFYRPEFHPDYTPRCHCKIASILRVVQKKKVSFGRYFWMCNAGSARGKKSCSFFQWADFDDDGRPKKEDSPGTKE